MKKKQSYRGARILTGYRLPGGLTPEQRKTINQVFPDVSVQIFCMSDGNIIADCGDERPIIIYRNGEWDFV